MYFRSTIPALVSSLLIAVLCCILMHRFFLFADTAFLAFPRVAFGEVFPVLQFSSNSYFAWRFEPLSFLLFGRTTFSVYFSGIVFLTVFGFSQLIHCLNEKAAVVGGLCSALLGALFLLAFGADILLWSVLLVFAWQALYYVKHHPSSRRGHALDIAMAVLSCGFANAMALPVSLLVWVVFSRGRQGALMLLLIFVYALFFPSPEFPKYESFGHLVPQWGVVDGLQPLVGDAPPLLHIDRQFVREAYFLPAIVILAITFLVMLFTRFRSPALERSGVFMLFFLGVSLLFDTSFLSADLSQVSPIQSISRLLPGAFGVSLTPLFFALALGFLTIVASRYRYLSLSLPMLLAVILLNYPIHTRRLDARVWQQASELPENEQRDVIYAAMQSPSYWIVRRYSPIVLLEQLKKRTVFERAAHFNFSTRTSSNPGARPMMFDGKDATAWSGGVGKQTGNEWILFRFQEPVSLDGVRLETGKYFTDFPRGFEVLVSPSCPENMDPGAELKSVFREERSEGELLFSSAGFPYFSQQYTVAAHFAAEEVQCLLVKQIGVEPNFDWSVSEVFFSKPPAE